jgi:hypothetical protein
MAEFIQNPRRSPRAPARCRTAVISAQGSFEATTEDVGGHGCQLVSPRLVRKGEPIQLVLSHEAMRDPLRIAGRVAWASERAPWRLGIAYDEATLAASQSWFEELLSHVPGLSAFKRIPERIPMDAVVYLATPPRFLVDFTPDEVAVLRSLGSGTSVAELRSLLRDRWNQAQRALFSLLAHQHVTLTRGGSVHPDAWKRILSEAESALAVESLRNAPVPDLTPSATPLPPAAPGTAPLSPARPAPATRPAVSQAPVPTAPAWPPAALTPIPVQGAWPEPRWPGVAAAPAAWPQTPAPPAHGPPPRAAPIAPAAETPDWAAISMPPAPVAPDAGPDQPDWLVPAADLMPAWPEAAPAPLPSVGSRGVGRGIDGGGGWNATPPPLTGGFALRPQRSAEAEGCYQRALAELEAGRLAGATALLRRALALAPGDAEIAGALAQVTERKQRG